jgi:hypothetical protein
MQPTILRSLCFVLAVASAASAGTVAYWRFEEGPAEMPVSASGRRGRLLRGYRRLFRHGNELSVWNESWPAFAYHYDAAYLSGMPQTAPPYNFSIRNIGTHPSIWTNTRPTLSIPSGLPPSQLKRLLSWLTATLGPSLAATVTATVTG